MQFNSGRRFKPPTTTVLSAPGPGNYNPPAGCRWIWVRIWGSGGGGAGAGVGSTNGSFGGPTNFAGVSAAAGNGGGVGDGGAGGVGGAGAASFRRLGQTGGCAQRTVFPNITSQNGGYGGGGTTRDQNGAVGKGGGGASISGADGQYAGGGGGEGEYVEIMIPRPVGPIAFNIGTGGAGGLAGSGSGVGGTGGNGQIWVIEGYN